MSRFVDRLKRSAGRGPYCLVALFAFWCALEVVGSFGDKSQAVFFYWILLPLSVLYALIWPLATFGRLVDIGWSGWLTPVFAIPFVLFVWIGCQGRSPWMVALLVVLVLSQLPLGLIEGKQAVVREPAEPGA